MFVVVEDVHGDRVYVENLWRVVRANSPSVVALEMLPKGPYDPATAHSVTRYYGSYYDTLAAQLAADGFQVVGLEEPQHRPFPDTTLGRWRNVVTRGIGRIERDWARTIAEYGGSVVAFVGSMHVKPLLAATRRC